MRALFPVSLVVVALVIAGCATKKASNAPPAGGASADAFGETSFDRQVTAAQVAGPAGVVAKVNTAGRFVVLTFPPGHIPAIDQQFSLYRLGNKVGEVKITGPQMDQHIVADLLNGEAETGDAVRSR